MKRRIAARPTAGVAEAAPADSVARAAERLREQRTVRKPRLKPIARELRNGLTDAAWKELREYLAAHADDVEAICLMARAELREGRREKAAALLARCLELAPRRSVVRFDYARALFGLHNYPAALEMAETLLTQESDNPLFLRLKADILAAMGEDEDSLAILKKLAAENPAQFELWVACGNGLRTVGRTAGSIAAYRTAIGCRPWLGSAWWGLANLKTFRFAEADVAAMQEQLKRPDIGEEDRANLLFALGKAHEDAGAYEASFREYAKANAARRLRVDYDWDEIASDLLASKTLFTPEFFESRSGAGCRSPDPVFVLGRPRSGSTLVEQILSSHSAVEGTAELPYMAALAFRLDAQGSRTGSVGYPQILATIDPARLTALGEEYLRDAQRHRKLGRPFFIDKAPANYHQLGMIHLMLPRARIVDARRHPAACCFSMFKHNYIETNMRLGELGMVWRQYVELMAHFERVLPGRVHRVIYEDLVADPEGEIRRLLDYLGLPFEESCLRFYESSRTVRSPSSEQVRRPISAEAVDHWRHFQPWLSPLLASLGSALASYPAIPEDLS